MNPSHLLVGFAEKSWGSQTQSKYCVSQAPCLWIAPIPPYTNQNTRDSFSLAVTSLYKTRFTQSILYILSISLEKLWFLSKKENSVLNKWRREKSGKGDRTVVERGITKHHLRYLESLSHLSDKGNSLLRISQELSAAYSEVVVCLFFPQNHMLRWPDEYLVWYQNSPGSNQ